MTRRSLDLVLVNPGGRTRLYQSLGHTLTAVENPVWAGLIATFIRRRGRSVAIVDADADELAPDEVAERVAALAPRLCVVVVYGHQPSASTQNMTGASAATTAIKRLRPDTPTLMVGGHVAALPERTLAEEQCDFVARDEGLYAIADLLDALDATGSGSSVRPRDLRGVRGLVYFVDDQVVSNPAAPLVRQVDEEMPGIAWDLIPMAKYRAHNWHCFGDIPRQPYAALYTTLGCPFHCSFCCIQAPFKEGERASGLAPSVNSYRFWSIDRIVGEIDLLVNNYGVRNIKFADEMFVLNARHVNGLCDALIERRYDLNIWAYARVDTVKEGMLDRLKQAGFNWLAFGIEAGNERVLRDVDKGCGIDTVYRTLEQVRKTGINIIGNYIFGLPEDTHETMQQTLNLALDLNCEFGNFYTAMAYPGSPLYRQALSLGWRLPATWSGYSQHARETLPLPTNHLSAGDVLRFRDDAFRRYYSDPGYLAMIHRKFGDATVEGIRAMSRHTLDREYASA